MIVGMTIDRVWVKTHSHTRNLKKILLFIPISAWVTTLVPMAEIPRTYRWKTTHNQTVIEPWKFWFSKKPKHSQRVFYTISVVFFIFQFLSDAYRTIYGFIVGLIVFIETSGQTGTFVWFAFYILLRYINCKLRFIINLLFI
jgi:hypothetical protein